VITTVLKSKPKPSVQSKFMLDAMEEQAKKDSVRLEHLQEHVDLICSKLEAHDAVQMKMAAQMELTSQALS
jgi:hypothetical protein